MTVGAVQLHILGAKCVRDTAFLRRGLQLATETTLHCSHIHITCTGNAMRDAEVRKKNFLLSSSDLSMARKSAMLEAGRSLGPLFDRCRGAV